MILDKISNVSKYYGVLKNLEEGISFAMSVKDAPLGRYDDENLPAGDVFVLVQEGETLPIAGGQVEAHRKYADVQILLEGGEIVGYAELAGLEEAVPYSEEKDVAFYRTEGQPIRVDAGMFYIVLPQDGHLPSRHLDTPGKYRKMVLKIRL